jgi:hypothetical protein
MKLLAIWNARDALGRLSQLRKPPKLAYRLMKYERKFMKEYGLCEEQKNKLVYEAAGVEFGSPNVTLQPGTAEHMAFVLKFTEFLEQEAELEPVGIDMDALIEGLDAEKGNVLSEGDLELMEPFFQVKVADLKLVEKA